MAFDAQSAHILSIVVEQSTPSEEAGRVARVQRIGRWLILVGVLVWGVWLLVKMTGEDPNLKFFLPFHLSGVIPGAILSRWGSISAWIKRRG